MTPCDLHRYDVKVEWRLLAKRGLHFGVGVATNGERGTPAELWTREVRADVSVFAYSLGITLRVERYA